MIPQLKSEFRKLLSVRSTYIIIIIAFALISLFSYFGTSANMYSEAVCESSGEMLYSGQYNDPRLQEVSPEEICGGEVIYTTKTSNELSKDKLVYDLQEATALISTFIAIVVVLLMAHEFRYNTVNYTLTISNSRTRVLLAKVVVSVVFTIVITLLAMGLNIVVTKFAIQAKDLVLPAQDYNWLYITARHLGYTLGFALASLGIITLVRNLTAGIAAIFILPTVNSIAAMLLADRNIEPTKLLPFSALDRFGNVASDVASNELTVDFLPKTSSGTASALHAGLVFTAYLIGLWIVTWLVFKKRDAN